MKCETIHQVYSCDICGAYHRLEWDGDCRENAERLQIEDLEAKYGEEGKAWIEVDMPTWDDET